MRGKYLKNTLQENCSYSEFFWYVFSHIRTEYGEIRCISPYSAECRKIRTRKTLNVDTFQGVIKIYVDFKAAAPSAHKLNLKNFASFILVSTSHLKFIKDLRYFASPLFDISLLLSYIYLLTNIWV